ncbi:RluA family pseudouridine synthase [Candidatus Saccharibacteria bacterium]|nr:RluA family pseudouridine synthase [Candidatus Saccharibacteria bacterium]NCS82833.1 RluA family pseudouridine synthase [Candidatus Saccharibacteria bacterium]
MATKNITREILSILRQFEVAGELSVPREISDIRQQEPKVGVRMLRFMFQTRQYYAIVDNNADDDTTMLQDYIAQDQPHVSGEFIRNPHETSFQTYGIRHKFHDTYLYVVTPLTQRLDKELNQRYPDISRSTLQKYVKEGYVRVNGEVCTKTKQEVTPHDNLAVTIPDRIDYSDQALPIVYIDDHVIVVSKPAGVLTHSKGVMNDEFTVADFFRRYTTNGLASSRPGIVHRLDRDTTGLIIGARNDDAAALLKKQFAARTAHKEYVAIVKGVPKQSQARIDLPIGRNPSSPSTFRVDPSGKAAVTSYQVMASNGEFSLVLLKPETGRTHQLRVHMQYINTPIVGDRVYGSGEMGDRLLLHAYKLEITTPPSHRQAFSAPLPDEFTVLFPGEVYGNS